MSKNEESVEKFIFIQFLFRDEILPSRVTDFFRLLLTLYAFYYSHSIVTGICTTRNIEISFDLRE